MLLYIMACVTERAQEEACFASYLDDAEAAQSAWYACSEADEEGCDSTLGTANSDALAGLSTCAGDGCVSEWVECVGTSDDLACFSELEACGGWVSTGLVNDCLTDQYACGSSEGCMLDYFECLRFATRL